VAVAVVALVTGGASAVATSGAQASAPATLVEQWHATTVATANEPILWHDRVIVTADNTTTALGLAHGAQVWRDVHPDENGLHLSLGAPTLSTLGEVDVSVYTIAGAGAFFYDPATGTFGRNGPSFHTIRGQLVVDGPTTGLIDGGYGSGVGPLFLLEYGGLSWFVDFGSASVGTPRLSGGRAFVTLDNAVVGVDPAQGCQPLPIPNPPPFCEVTWSHALSGHPQRPSFGGAGRVAVGDDNGVVTVLDAATGAEVWHDFFGPLMSATTYAGGVLFVAASDGVLRAIDAATGAVRWTGTVGSAVSQAPMVAAGRVWVATDDGRVVAFTQSGCPSHACAPVAVGDSGTAARAAGAPLVRNGVVVAAFGSTVAAFATG
jgi:outer membrane protein assembly factor BamB